MSIYRCNKCENFYDCDEVGCEADPQDDCNLLCLDCYHDEMHIEATDKLII